MRPWAAREGMPGNGSRHVSTQEVVWRSGDGTRVWENLRLSGSFMTIGAAGQGERRFPELLTGRLSADGWFMLTPTRSRRSEVRHLSTYAPEVDGFCHVPGVPP